MKNFINRIIFPIIIFQFFTKAVHCQVGPDSIPVASAGSFFDKVFDNNGKVYNLAALHLPDSNGKHSYNSGAKVSSIHPCNSGYFTLWFEQDWDGIFPNKLSAANATIAKATICQVFADVSNLIVRPAGATDKVQIWIRDITQMGIAVPSTSATRALSSAFSYAPPYNSGVSDNVVWLTINGGKDGWLNVATPLAMVGTGSGSLPGFYHGQLGINYSNTNLPWFLSSTSSAAMAVNEVDLYTVLLHEVLHMLGVTSNINETGTSSFGAAYKYYTRYDLALKTNAGTSLLSTPSNTCNLIYNNTFNAAVPLTQINSTGNINTGTQANNSISCSAIKYVQGNILPASGIPVYTPATFEPTFSLSHLEDECALAGFSVGAADEDKFYVMSNLIVPQTKKRVPREHERIILNNIGYKVNTNYTVNFGNGGTASTYTTTTISTPAIDVGIRTVGYCDGFAGNTYTYQMTAGGVNLTIPFADLVANDRNPLGGIACVEILNNPSCTLTITATQVIIAAPLGAATGIMLLRYLPTTTINGTTFFGNITYIYVKVNGNCPSNLCGNNLVNNGGFENFTPGFTCGWGVNADLANCWGSYTGTPDIWSRNSNCFNTPLPIPVGNIMSAGLTVWNPLTANDRVAFLGGWLQPPAGNYTESITSKLNSGLTPGATYQVKFKAVAATNNGGGYTTSANCNLSIMGSNANLVGGWQYTTSNSGLLPLSTALTSITVPNNSTWYTYSFTFTAPITVVNHIIAANNYYGALPPPYTTFKHCHIAIDDIEIRPVVAGAITFTPPATASCTTINNLSSYLSSVPTNGLTFTGPNGSCYFTGTQWNFDPLLAGNGNAIITCNYIDADGCPVVLSANILVSGLINITVTSNPCVPTGGTATLTVNGAPAGATITWTNSSNVVIGSTSTVAVSAAGNYFVTVTSGGCTSTVGFSNQASQCNNTLVTILPTTISATPAANVNGYAITANTTITGSNVFIKNTDVTIKNGATITVANNAALTIEASHLWGCTAMWGGIVVSPGGKLIIKGNLLGSSLIEDAYTAVSAQGHTATTTILDISNTIFNKNKVGVDIGNYVQNTATYPFKIESSVFTRRVLPPPNCSLQWPNWVKVAALQAITTNTVNVLPSTYSTLTNCAIAPFLSIVDANTTIHIKAKIVGYTGGSITAPIYSGQLNINTSGITGVPPINLLDVANRGISAENANIAIVNCVIQNCKYGISAISGVGFRKTPVQLPYSNLRVVNNSVGSNFLAPNKFYDNEIASIDIGNYAHVDITKNDFRSTQTLTNYTLSNGPPPQMANANIMGKCAINIRNGNTLVHNITNNTIYNHKVGVVYQQVVQAQSGSSTTLTQFCGLVNVSTNTIQPAPTGALTGTLTPFVCEGISASMTGGGSIGTTFTVVAADSRLNIASNTISKVFRGIEVSNYNWTKHNVAITDNLITQDADPAGTLINTSMQHGIWCNNTKGSLYVKSNSVTYNGCIPASVANIPTYFNTASAINNPCPGRQSNFRFDQNERQVITCNTSVRGNIGFEFNGAVNPVTRFRQGNKMGDPANLPMTHFFGFLLNNGAIIGVQPGGISATCATANVDAGNSWNFTATNTANQPKHTWVQNPVTIAPTLCFTTLQSSGAGLSAFEVPAAGVNRPANNSGSGGAPTLYGTLTNASLRTVTAASPAGCASALDATSASFAIAPPNLLALNAIPSGMAFDAMSTELNYLNRYYLYTLQKSNSDYINLSPELQSFYDNANLSTNSYRKMYDIDLALADDDYATAQTLNTAFASSNFAEANTKSYNAIEIRYKTNGSLNAADMTELIRIANECPHTDGICVYYARNLYNTIKMQTDGNYYSFGENCNPSGLYKMAKPAASVVGFEIMLYPNPTSGACTLQLTNGSAKEINVVVSDMQGRVVQTQTIAMRGNAASINTALPSGVYLVKITNENDESSIKKLLIE